MSTTQHNQTTPMTIEDLAELIRGQTRSIDDLTISMNQRMDQIDGRLREMDERITTQSSEIITLHEDHEKLKNDGEVIQTTLNVSVKNIEQRMREEARRLAINSNILLFGLPETQGCLDLAKRLMAIISPDFAPTLTNNRLGKETGEFYKWDTL